MSFKLLRGEEEKTLTFVGDNFFLPRRLNNFEFCFQFDDCEPISFGTGPNDLHIHITPTENGNITFTNNDGKIFKIFAREIQ